MLEQIEINDPSVTFCESNLSWPAAEKKKTYRFYNLNLDAEDKYVSTFVQMLKNQSKK